MDSKQAVRLRFKAPEGRYQVHTEKLGAISFNYQRSTRLTSAILQGGGPEDGHYILCNVADVLYVIRFHEGIRETVRSLPFAATAFPTCHSHMAAKDGVDTLVGLSDGSAMVLSLKTHLQGSSQTVKPSPASTLTPEGSSETSRTVAVAWVPKVEPAMFAVACSTGNVYLYKKSAVLGESTSKFSISLGSSKQSSSPAQTISVPGGGVNDMAVSPCGTRIAVACKDGALRVLDIASGTVTGGFQSYYGAMLCCSFSPDGRYVTAGGEDDLIAIYGIQERYPVAHGEGHRSWVSRVHFDPYIQYGGMMPTGTSLSGTPLGSSAAALADVPRMYRLGSVGQDAQLCLWDIPIPLDGELPVGFLPPVSTMRRTTSLNNMHQHTSSSSASHQRKPSLGRPLNGATITPAMPHDDMNVNYPIMEHRVHLEPISDIMFLEGFIMTADHSGAIKAWSRPAQRSQATVSEDGDANSQMSH